MRSPFTTLLRRPRMPTAPGRLHQVHAKRDTVQQRMHPRSFQNGHMLVKLEPDKHAQQAALCRTQLPHPLHFATRKCLARAHYSHLHLPTRFTQQPNETLEVPALHFRPDQTAARMVRSKFQNTAPNALALLCWTEMQNRRVQTLPPPLPKPRTAFDHMDTTRPASVSHCASRLVA